MALDTRELFARLIQCEAGGEGEQGMAAVATVVMNRATATEGEFSRVGNGGDVRACLLYTSPSTNFQLTIDGFIISDNVQCVQSDVIDKQFACSDHNPVYMNFILK